MDTPRSIIKITPKFYPQQCKVFHAAASLASFPSEMLQATIITLPKPGKEPDKAQNFSPISVLNINPKVYPKPLANRIA